MINIIKKFCSQMISRMKLF